MMASDNNTIKVFCSVTAQNGERVPLETSKESTPTQLRRMVSEATSIPLGELRLIFRGRMIKDDDGQKVVEEYKLEPECVLHCMGKPTSTGGAPSTTPAPSMPTASVPAASPQVVPPATTMPAPTAAASPPSDPVADALLTLQRSNPPNVYSTAVNTLSKILSNIATHPMEAKYRKVKKQNAAFQKRLGGLTGGEAAMLAVGFVVITEDNSPVYDLQASAEAWPKLMAAKATVEQAAQRATQAAASPAPPAANPFAAGSAGGMPGAMPGAMPGMGLPGMNTPAGAAAAMNNPMMQNAMADMMSNPDALRNMLQNPAVQQMIQNDPNVSPMQRQAMQQLASNPAMMQQLSNMMQDPAMRGQVQAMMGAAGGASGNPMGGFPTFPTQPTQQPTQQATQPPTGAVNNATAPANNPRNDQDQTEEEMIAEAIRRSLEEG